jgi:hypothetical protein
VVVAIVLGILGMHGIGAHGVNLHGPVAHAADAATPAAPAMPGHDTAAGAAPTVSDVHSGLGHPRACWPCPGGSAGRPAGRRRATHGVEVLRHQVLTGRQPADQHGPRCARAS